MVIVRPSPPKTEALPNKKRPWTNAMVSRLITVQADAPVSSLMEIFNRGMVAIVMDGATFLGLVTRIDLLNWLRRRL